MLAPLPPADSEKVALLRAKLPATDAGMFTGKATRVRRGRCRGREPHARSFPGRPELVVVPD
jgi:hypothetical protein